MAPYSFPQGLQQALERDIVSGALARGQWFSCADLHVRYQADPSDLDRLSLSSNRLPLVWTDIHIRTDRYHYVSALWPQAADLLQVRRGES